MHRISTTHFLACALVVLSGCVAINDYDRFDFAGDAGPDTGGRDGGPVPDGGTDGGPTDGGPTDSALPDGGLPDSGPRACTGTCIADAVLEFDADTQGTHDLEWRYLKNTRDAEGVGFVELVSGAYGSVTGWVDGTPPPAIVACGAFPGSEECAGLRDLLLFAADGPAEATGGDPALGFTASEDTTVIVSGTYRSPDGLSSAESVDILVSRNSLHDAHLITTAPVDTTEHAFSVPVDVFQGDRVFLTARATGTEATAPPIGLDFRVSRDLDRVALADCMFAATFDDTGSDLLLEGCRGMTTFTEVLEGGTSVTPTASVAPWLGTAAQFQTGVYLDTQAVPMDYSGDFTIQLWVNIDYTSRTTTPIYTDMAGYNQGGIGLDFNSDETRFRFLFADPGDITEPGYSCDGELCTGTITIPNPPFDAWHFYRLVRSTADGEVRFCVDGEVVDRLPAPSDVDMTSGRSPILGSWEFGLSSSYLNAKVDDIRIIKRALPCGGM